MVSDRSLWKSRFVWFVAFLAIFGIRQDGLAESPIVLRDVTSQTGVSFTHTDGGSGQRYIMETVSAGLALLDYDGDGDIDVYFLNGAPLKGNVVESTPKNALYRNDGGFRFTDVTEQAGVGDIGYGLGVVVGDYDSDGDPDLFLNNYGGNVLYRNNGDGTFADVTEESGLTGAEEKVGAGACFLDADGDGDLDLYVASYLDFDYATHIRNMWLGFHVYLGPDHYIPTTDRFFLNNGDSTFTDASVASGIAAAEGRGMGIVCADYDNDGDTDIFVANDSSPNFLFENDGSGKFEEVGLVTGIAYDLYGSLHGSMGVDCGDFDNDGLLDFYQTSYQGQTAALYHNLGQGLFEDVTMTAKAGIGTLPHVTWGNGLVDFDNDGHRDIFVARGHLYDNVDEFSDVTSYKLRNLLLRNEGNGTFSDISNECGDGLSPVKSSRGAAFDDLDNDGDIDAVILNSREMPTLLRNDSENDHHWIQVELEGTKTNQDGAGAQVRVTAGDLNLIDEVHLGRSYQSHYGTRLHFGLGERDQVDRVEVRWIGGESEVFEVLEVDRLHVFKEGAGEAVGI
jgi:enediyne biosynthesis protein E4